MQKYKFSHMYTVLGCMVLGYLGLTVSLVCVCVCAYGTSELIVCVCVHKSTSEGKKNRGRGVYARYTADIRGAWYSGILGSRYP
jgi:hypothetical protein